MAASPEITDKMLRIASKAFFRDGVGMSDYPHETWEQQYEEFKTLLATGGVSAEFISKIYEWNKDSSDGAPDIH